jgi:hypothetical protein
LVAILEHSIEAVLSLAMVVAVVADSILGYSTVVVLAQILVIVQDFVHPIVECCSILVNQILAQLVTVHSMENFVLV